ncbi:MAG: CBS domain-containing protein [Peptococcaceae bacterium]|nr:CBS domain-containing protein [Peptococcaceae bacterium]
MKIILSHRYHDFDALASMVAAQRLWPDAVLVIEGISGSAVQDFLALAKEQLPYIRLKDIEPDKVQEIILVDTHDLQRAVSNRKVLEKLKNAKLKIFDHHPYNGPKDENISIQTVGACTTILVEMIVSRGIKISSFDATLMALGIYDDTGSLLFESTTARDLLAAAFLLEQGAQLGVISDYLRRPLTREQMDIFQQLLDNGQTEKFNGTSVYISYAESNMYCGGLALLAHRLGEIESAAVWFIVVKMEDRIYLVGRSRGESLPVNKIMQAFGGAGHHKAASAVVKQGEIDSVLTQLKNEIRSRVTKPYLIKDIMSFPVKTVSPDTSIAEVGELLLKYGYTGVPVVDNKEQLKGVISRRDVDKALKHGLGHAPVKGFMAREVVTVKPDQSWEEAHGLMVTHDIGRLPVVNDSQLVGIVSRSDILSLLYRSVVPVSSQLEEQRSAARREQTLNQIKKMPAEQQALLAKIKKVADNITPAVYLVGGFVRDLFLGVPTKDLDIVVEGNGIKFAQNLSLELKPCKLVLHEPFGTASLQFADGTHIDIASTRRENYDFPGALPVVETSSLKEDLFRRDFTINALAMCINRECYGQVIDYYGGLRDLKQGEIRFLHNLSFIDDPTRILRAIRFAGRYNFRLAKVTGDAITTALEADVFSQVSPERFTEELLLIYDERNYQAMGLKLLQTGVLTNWFKVDLPWNFTEQQNVGPWPLEKRWLVSIKNFHSEQIETVIDRLALSRSMLKVTTEYGQTKEKLRHYLENRGQVQALDPVELDKILYGVPTVVRDVLALDDRFATVLKRYIIALSGVDMKTTGSDLIKLGFKEGPEIGLILQEIRNLWLRGQIETREEEIEYLKEIIHTRKK